MKIKEYFRTQNRFKAFGLKYLFNYGVGKIKELVHKVETEYDYDLPPFIRGVRTGELSVTPLPVQLAQRITQLPSEEQRGTMT